MTRTRLLTLILGATALACFEDPVTTTTNVAAETSGDGDGDPATGDGDGDATGDGDGDATGDGDGDATGDGDGDATGDGDGDATGDGDGDATGDGDGDEPVDEVLLDFALDLCDFGDETILSFYPDAGVQFLSCPSPTKTSPDGGALVEEGPTLDGGQNFPGPQLLIYAPNDDAPSAQTSVQFNYVPIQQGDRLQFTAGCGAGKQSCSALIEVNWFDGNNAGNNLIPPTPIAFQGGTFDVDIALDEAAGQAASIVVIVLSDSSSGDDSVYFGNGRILRPAAP